MPTLEEIDAEIARREAAGNAPTPTVNGGYTLQDIDAEISAREKKLVGISKGESAARAASQGLTFSFGDEILGGLAGIGSIYDGGDIAKNIEQSYYETRDENRAANKLSEEANPKTYFVADIGSSLLLPGGAIKAAVAAGRIKKLGEGANRVQKFIQGAKNMAPALQVAGGSGILQGAGRSEAATAPELIKDAAVSGAVSTAIAPVAVFGANQVARGAESLVNKFSRKAPAVIDEAATAVSGGGTEAMSDINKNLLGTKAEMSKGLGIPEEKITDSLKQALLSSSNDVVELFKQNVGKGFTPEQALIKAQAEKFGVRMSLGDITQNVTRQGEEDLALKGAYGQQAEVIAKTFRDAQQQDIKGAVGKVTKAIGGDEAIPNESVVAESITGKLKSLAQKDKNTASQAYDAVSIDSTTRKTNLADLPKALNKALEEKYVDIEAAPAVSRRLKELDAIVKSKSKKEPTGLLDAEGNPVFRTSVKDGDVSFATLENYRKRLNASLRDSSDKAEIRGLKILQNTYDNYVDGIIDRGLIDGDEKVIKQLQTARGLWKDYRQKYYGADGKAIIGKIVDGAYTEEEVVRMLVGSGKAGSQKGASRAVNKLKSTLGDDSDEFNALKRTQFGRLLGVNTRSILEGDLSTPISGKIFAKNYDDFIKTNKSLAESLFKPDELKLMADMAKVTAQATTRQPGAVNYSGTTPVLLRFATQMMNKIPVAGKYLAGATNSATRGATNAAKEAELTKSFTGDLSKGAGKKSSPFAENLGVKAGLASEKNIIPTSEPKKNPDNPEQQSLNVDISPTKMAADPIYSAIDSASELSGIESDLLRRIAQKESGLNPDAKNPNSSAEGLFQFTKNTWNEMVGKYGKDLGITKADIKDPKANAIMGGLYTRKNRDTLTAALDRAPTDGELYMAHFLGASGADKMIRYKDSDVAAARLFPQAAKSNKSIFFDGRKARTVREVYDLLSKDV